MAYLSLTLTFRTRLGYEHSPSLLSRRQFEQGWPPEHLTLRAWHFRHATAVLLGFATEAPRTRSDSTDIDFDSSESVHSIARSENSSKINVISLALWPSDGQCFVQRRVMLVAMLTQLRRLAKLPTTFVASCAFLLRHNGVVRGTVYRNALEYL
jgi:hypothetical protein